LGAFDTPKSQAALQGCLENEDLGALCTAALYRITKSEDLYARLKNIEKEDPDTFEQVQSYLKEHGVAE